VTRSTQADERKWDFIFVGDVWLDGGIRMNMVARVAIQHNPEREAWFDVFEGIFIGELFLFSFALCM
jgi:hypothetical protein